MQRWTVGSGPLYAKQALALEKGFLGARVGVWFEMSSAWKEKIIIDNDSSSQRVTFM